MKKITIEGKFSGPVNKYVVLDVFRPNGSASPYDFKKTYNDSFKETLQDLDAGLTYNIDFSGYSADKFDLTISGEFENPNPITDSFDAGSFSPGYAIHTTP